MKIATRFLTVMVTLLTLGIAEALAEDPITISRVKGDTEIRFRTFEDLGTWRQGRFVEDSGRELVLEIDGELQRFTKIDLADFQVRSKKGNHAGSGAGIGAILGGGAALGVGVSMAKDDFFEVETSDVIAGTLVGAAGGALVGALFGAAIPKDDWVDVLNWSIDMQVAPDGSPAASLSFRF